MKDDNELNELNPPVMDGYTKIPTFKLWVANRFPYMETDFDGITNYELLEALTNYLNNVIKNEETVESNVAKLNQAYLQLFNYVKDYFDNLDVQEEINNKLDDLVADGTLTRLIGEYVQPLIDEQNQEISNFKTQVNNQIATQNAQIQAVASGSPFAASSVAGMTDTARVYVNTTDGNWYYYNGTQWVIGGVYQASNLDINSVAMNNFNNLVRKTLYKEIKIEDLGLMCVSGTTETLFTDAKMSTSSFYILKGTTITTSSDFASKFNWQIKYKSSNNYYGNRTDVLVNTTSYTADRDEIIRIEYQPVGNWSDLQYYSADTPLTSNDINFVGYFILKNPNINELFNSYINLNDLLEYANLVENVRYYRPTNSRASITKIIKSNYPLFVTAKAGWDYVIYTWNGEKFGVENLVNDSGWKHNGTVSIIPANTYFSLTFKKEAGGQITDSELKKGIFTISSYPNNEIINEEIDNKIAQAIPDTSTNYAYQGEHINFNKNGYNFATHNIINLPQSQGMAIYENYILIYFGNSVDELRIYNKDTMELLSTISITLGHGDTMQFSNKFYDNNDLLPLLYVTSDSSPSGYCYVTRISNLTTAEIVKSYFFDLTNNGYYQGYTCDFVNNKLYCLGYKEANFQTNPNGTNRIIVSIYDLSKENFVAGNNYYTLDLIERYELPFIYCIQGQKWFDGKIFCCSSYWPTNKLSELVVIDPYKKAIVTVFDDLPATLANLELEDLDFVLENNKYYMLINTRKVITEGTEQGGIYKLSF